MIQKGRYTFTPVCDGCGVELSAEQYFDLAIGAMKESGWAILRPSKVTPEWYHFCPACKERGKKNV